MYSFFFLFSFFTEIKKKSLKKFSAHCCWASSVSDLQSSAGSEWTALLPLPTLHCISVSWRGRLPSYVVWLAKTLWDELDADLILWSVQGSAFELSPLEHCHPIFSSNSFALAFSIIILFESYSKSFSKCYDLEF